eukprot:jgi/Botrbrau1/2382/Bobra.0395s0014.1
MASPLQALVSVGEFGELYGVPVPPELRNVDPDVLKDFVDHCHQQRAHHRDIGQDDRRDTRHRTPREGETYGSGRQLVLSEGINWLGFGHECHMLVACSRSSCEMCASSQMRECDSAAPKRLYEDEVLSTPCDSPNIWVELHMGNQSNCPLRDLGVEFFLIDGQEYDPSVPVDKVARLEFQGKPLLASKTTAPQGVHSLVRAKLEWNRKLSMFIARLPDLYVTANTTAVRKKNGLSPVRDPSFRLVVRPINLETGVQISEIRMAVSRPFRVVVDKAGEGKAEKPLLDDPVHLLAGIGPETVNKLKDLAAQTKDKDIQLPFARIETVRQLRELVRWTRQGGPGNQGRDQAVRNAINMRRGAWNEVQVAVLQAIENDINVRIWYTDLEMRAGLLFCACRGTTRVADPIGVFCRETQMDEGEQHDVLVIKRVAPATNLNPDQVGPFKRALDAARAAWQQADHGSWASWVGVSSAEFKHEWILPEGLATRTAPYPKALSKLSNVPPPALMRPVDEVVHDLPFETAESLDLGSDPPALPPLQPTIEMHQEPMRVPHEPYIQVVPAPAPALMHPTQVMVGNHSLGNSNSGVPNHHGGPHRPEAIRAADPRANGKLSWVQGLNSGPGVVEAPVSAWPGANVPSQMRPQMPVYHQPPPELSSHILQQMLQFVASAFMSSESHQYVQGPPMMNPGPPLNMPVAALPQPPPPGPQLPPGMPDPNAIANIARYLTHGGYTGPGNFPTKPER